MSRVSLKGICDMHVHTNPDLRHRAYSDLELADAAVRVGARAIVIKSCLLYTSPSPRDKRQSRMPSSA